MTIMSPFTIVLSSAMPCLHSPSSMWQWSPLSIRSKHLGSQWMPPGRCLGSFGSDPEKKGSNGTKINSAFVGSYAKLVFTHSKISKTLVCECENRQDASTGQSSFFPNIFTKKVGLGTLKLMIISFYKRNAIIVKWETTPGLHQPLWAWSIPTGPAFGTVPANDAAGRCPGQAPYRRRGCSAPQGSNCWQLPGIMFCFIKLYWKMIGLLLSHLKWFNGI